MVFFLISNMQFIFGRGSAPDPAEGAYDAPDLLIGSDGEGDTSPRIHLDAFGVWISAPTQCGCDRAP